MVANDGADNNCGWFARVFFRAAWSLISFQSQRGRRYPSQFSLNLLKYSANQGHVQAMAQLGRLLYSCGVCRADKRNGLEYLRRAARGGDVNAQYLLGSAYLDGTLVRQDDKTARHWLTLAADSGHAEAVSLLQSCRSGSQGSGSQEAHADETVSA